MSTLSSSVRSTMSSASVSLVEVLEITVADALYEDESFEEESGRQQLSPAAQPETEERRGKASSNGDDNAYDDDAFEDEPAATLDDGDDYSTDAFEDQGDELQVGHDEAEAKETAELSGSQGDEEAIASYGGESFEADSAADEAKSPSHQSREQQSADEEELTPAGVEDCAIDTQAADDPTTPTFRHQWYSDKIKTLSTGNAHRGHALLSPATVAHTIPIKACHALQRQFLRKSKQLPTSQLPKGRHMRPSSKHALGASLPIEFIDKMLCNTKAQRLLHTPFDHLASESEQNEAHHQAAAVSIPHKHNLSTFCAVKRVNLEGKLATIRFETQWARSYTKHSFETNEMSIGTLSLLQEMMAAQRKILQTSSTTSEPAEETLFSCMQTRAPCLDLIVENTKRCLRDSQLLREQATRLLRRRGGAQTAAAS